MIIDQQIAFATLKLTDGSGVGSCLFVQRENLRFLFTAAHVCPSVMAGERVGIGHAGGWNYVDVLGVQRCTAGTDVAVLRVVDGTGAGLPWDQLDSAGAMVGEAISYCGFPLGLEMSDVPQMDGFPHPIVKSGTISAFLSSSGRSEFLIDTLNNRGFSGGPIVRMTNTGVRRVIALVSNYKFDAPAPVYKKLPDGKFEEIPDYYVQPNSGFMRGVCIRHARDAAMALIE